VPEPDDVAALKAVAAGRLAAAVVDQASFAFVQQRHGLAHLHMGEPVGFDYALSFAVRKDLPQLRDALDLGVRALSMDDRRQLRERWLVPASGPARWPRWAPWAAALVVVSAGVLAWRVIATRQLPRLDHSAPLQSG
jgi:ABC-type amino acid transport substrate-binding protein